MKLSTKAGLYSGLLFPGSGYFIVNKKRLGFLFLVVTLASLTILLIEAIHKAQVIAQDILSGTLVMDLETLREKIQVTPGFFSPETISAITYLIVALWLISIIDCYRIGQKLSKTTA